jgi:hypothetical protein
VQTLVKPPNVPDFPQLKHSPAEIKSMILPVYPMQLDKIDIEADKQAQPPGRAFCVLGQDNFQSNKEYLAQPPAAPFLP